MLLPSASSMKSYIFCIAVVMIALASVCDGKRKVVMEYIGDTGVPISMDSVPIDPKIDFHFILSFAVDANTNGEPQNGIFHPYWSTSITPTSVRTIKTRHRNVKVLASIFGDTDFGWYNPRQPEVWIINAFNSIKSMVNRYHLDGIDIDYEEIPKKDTTFIYCIGQLLTRLKHRRVITVATIAPSYETAGYYARLYRRYPSVIDYVNYQFDTDKGTASPRGYLRYFKQRATQFYGPKILPHYEIDGTGIREDAFFESLGLLESNGFQVNGVVIFSADASKAQGFYFEKKSQLFLLGGNRTVVY